MVIDNKFDIAQTVYLCTDNEQNKRIITSINVRPFGVLVYQVSYGTNVSDHYEFELTSKENVLTKTGVNS